MPMPKTIGHVITFPKGIVGLVKRGCWEIPEIMASSLMGLIGIGLAALGCYNYAQDNGDSREYKMVYTIVRSDDKKAKNIRNPVYTKYKG